MAAQRWAQFCGCSEIQFENLFEMKGVIMLLIVIKYDVQGFFSER